MPKADPTEVAVDGPRPYQTLIQRAQSQAAINASMGTTEEVAFELKAAAIDRIAESDTLDAIFDANAQASMPGVEDAAEKGPLTFLEIELRKSADEYVKGGLGVYVFCKCVTDTGEVFDWNTGAPNIVASLYRIQELGLLNKPEKPRLKIVGKKATNGILYRVARP